MKRSCHGLTKPMREREPELSPGIWLGARASHHHSALPSGCAEAMRHTKCSQPQRGRKNVCFQNWQETRGWHVMFFPPSLLFWSMLKCLSCTPPQTHVTTVAKGCRVSTRLPGLPCTRTRGISVSADMTACLRGISNLRLWSLHTWSPENSFYFKPPETNWTELWAES